MTYEEAITLIEEIRPKKCKMVDDRLQGGYPDHDSDIGKAIDMAIEALEKQIPKKPAVNMAEYGVCPTCGRSIDTDYCIYCGQAIDWSEEQSPEK